MKVLYIANDTPMAGGGTKSLVSMLRQAARHGVDYEVVCPDDKGLTCYLRDNGIMVHVIPFRHAILPGGKSLLDKLKWLPRLIHNSWLNYKAIGRIVSIAKGFGADMIHENSSVLNIGYHAAKKLNIPDVVHIREYGDLDFNLVIPGIAKRLASNSVYPISITKDIARHRNQLDNPHAAQIYNAVMKRSDLRYNPDKKKFFLYAGRVEECKGTSELIDAYIAYAANQEPPLPLYIAGCANFPDYQEKLMSRVKKAGLDKYVKWLGERMDIADIMYDTVCTIIPSRFEGFGRVMPEAMTNGSLCIGRNTGGTKEQMDNGRRITGRDIAFAYDTVAELSGLLSEVTRVVSNANPFVEGGEFHDMILRSQSVVDALYSEESFGNRLVDFYKRVLC